ncbi:MAG TPA: helix-turn-helix transcriptional regulator [Bryobacteraceae bacterium]|nr:helix-turn-helix transcriptional regulator [Bryobacteraceae bacterium]
MNKRLSIEELRRLAESDAPVLAFEFSRPTEKDWAPPHSHERGQLFALTQGLLILDAAGGRWMFPSRHCAWIPPGCVHAARSVGGTAGSMLYLSTKLCRGLPREPRVLGSSELLFAIVKRIHDWNHPQTVTASQRSVLTVLQDEIRRPEEQSLRLPIPRQAKLAKVARALLENVADDRTLDEWAKDAGMARRTFMRAFSSEMGLPFGRWRQQARLFMALEMLAQGESITDVAIAVGYNSVSAFIEVFHAALGTTPQAYFGRRKRRSPQQGVEAPKGHWEWREDIIPAE